ncbi:hypothetical protein, partial [Shewanella baltica]|uniref:hypothetical protein n=1 Tax=Shewanella baltica TaxID=62322 RepID=UPI001A8E549C
MRLQFAEIDIFFFQLACFPTIFTHQLTSSPAHQLTSSPAHQLTSSPAHQLTSSPAHFLIAEFLVDPRLPYSFLS